MSMVKICAIIIIILQLLCSFLCSLLAGQRYSLQDLSHPLSLSVSVRVLQLQFAVTIVFVWLVSFFFFYYCFSFHFLTLLNMFAHVMVAWCVPVSGHIQHDAKLWRAKTTTSPMGKSQYFISFWQARWSFFFFSLFSSALYGANTRG